MSQSNPEIPPRERFSQELRTALNGLFNPAVLRSSPLLDRFHLRQQRDPVAALRRILVDGIESLQPAGQTPTGSKSWRAYQILRRRYIEQRIQREVAGDLGLSLRQMQREEKVARETLTESLWKAYRLDENPLTELPGEPTQRLISTSLSAELEALKESIPVELVEIQGVIRDALETLQPVLAESGVSVGWVDEAEPVFFSVRAAIMRQVILGLLNLAAGQVRRGKIHVETLAQSGGVEIRISALPATDLEPYPSVENADDLEMTRQLISLCGGTLRIDDSSPELGKHFPVYQLALLANEPVPILVIDDNADALQLYQRYLADSRYQIACATSARTGLELLKKLQPRLIVLDVMMPEVDGWTFLGQLRVHPDLHGIPILVCSIIPQERLALSLGASEFLRKPVSRLDFLAALNRLTDPPVKGSG